MKSWISISIFLAIFFGIALAVLGEVAIAVFLPLLALIFIIRDYRIGVVCLMLLMPLDGTTLIPHIPGLNPINIFLAATFASFFIRKTFSRKRSYVKLPKFIWWRYIIPILIAISIGLIHRKEMNAMLIYTMGENFNSSFAYLFSFGVKPLAMITFAWMLGNAIRDSKNPDNYIFPLVIAILLPAFFILGYTLIRGGSLSVLSTSHARAFLSPLGLHANQFGAMLAIGLSILIFMLPVIKNSWAKFSISMSIATVIGALLLTFSRGGYLAALISVVYFLIVQRRIKLVAWGLVLVVIVGVLAPASVWDRATTGLGGGNDVLSSHVQNDELTAGRVWMWRQVLPSFWRSPIVGSGIASQAWSDAAKAGIVKTAQTHNFYLSILFDTGIVGFIIILSFFGYLYKSFKQISQMPTISPLLSACIRGVEAGFLGFMVQGFSNGRFWPQPEHIYIWMMFGIGLAFLPYAETSLTKSKFSLKNPALGGTQL